jgi:hypothetical protein
MSAVQIERTATEAFHVDTTKGSHNGVVSSQWFTRPADQRFTSLYDLQAKVEARRRISSVRTVDSKDIEVIAKRDDADYLGLSLASSDPLQPNHWSFGQLASLVDAPASYLRKLPAPIAAINLQHGVLNHRAEQIKTLEYDDGSSELAAITGPDYGRIFDSELVNSIIKIAGNGRGETRWKVPGVIDWSASKYNPFVDVTNETTTLYASDRDVFVFLVDDTHPIQAGYLKNGEPDYFFRGFYAWNSEVGSKSLGIATFYLRGVCQNRNLWGVEGFNEVTIRHSKFAGDRFAKEVSPALENYANSSPLHFIEGIKTARETIVATTDEERVEFLGKRGFAKGLSKDILETVFREEDKPAESVFDFVQGITAVARRETRTDVRLDLEKAAKKLLERV